MSNDPRKIAEGLTEAQRRRLEDWPHKGSVFYLPEIPDPVAWELCSIGIGNMVPWKDGQQMALLPLGLQVRDILKGDEA